LLSTVFARPWRTADHRQPKIKPQPGLRFTLGRRSPDDLAASRRSGARRKRSVISLRESNEQSDRGGGVESEHVLSQNRRLAQRGDSGSRRRNRDFEPRAVAQGVKGERQFAARPG